MQRGAGYEGERGEDAGSLTLIWVRARPSDAAPTTRLKSFSCSRMPSPTLSCAPRNTSAARGDTCGGGDGARAGAACVHGRVRAMTARLPACERPVARALHLRVDIAVLRPACAIALVMRAVALRGSVRGLRGVAREPGSAAARPEVVDGAAGAAQQHGACAEEEEQACVRQSARISCKDKGPAGRGGGARRAVLTVRRRACEAGTPVRRGAARGRALWPGRRVQRLRRRTRLRARTAARSPRALPTA